MLYPIELWVHFKNVRIRRTRDVRKLKRRANQNARFNFQKIENTPNLIRTDNLRFRRPMLYPIELWVRFSNFKKTSVESTPTLIRTDNLRYRRPMLYPIELWVLLQLAFVLRKTETRGLLAFSVALRTIVIKP